MASTPASFADCRSRRHRSGLRHDRRSGENPASPRLSATNLLLLLGRLPRQIRRRSGKISASPAPRPNRCRRHDLYLPDASAKSGRSGPGACPICGMALEPVSRRRPMRRPNPELLDMTRRFWIGLALTLPVVDAGNGRAFRRLSALWLSPQMSVTWIQLALATPVVLWAGWPFFVRGWRSFVTRKLNMFIADRTWAPASPGLTASSRRLRPRFSRRPFAARRRRRASISRRRRSSPCWCCSARCWSCAPASSTSGAIRALLDLAPKTARRIDGRRQRDRSPARRRPRRRSPAGAAGREDPGRRHRRRRPLLGRRIDGDGRIDAGDQDGRRQSHCRHAQPQRQLRDARREGRARHAASADRADGGRGAALAGADPAAGRSGVVVVRAVWFCSSRSSHSRLGRSTDRSRASHLRWWPR